MSKKTMYNGRKLATDKTDYMFDYFIDEGKFNNEMRDEWSQNKKTTDVKSSKKSVKMPIISSSSKEEELPSSVSSSISEKSLSSAKKSSVSSPYLKKIDPKPKTEARHKTEVKSDSVTTEEPKIEESYEARRARARDIFSELDNLQKNHGIILSRHYSINDDPDEMANELKMHRDRRTKFAQVKFYKQLLLNIVSGAEWLNEKYDPFDFKLHDWSKQIAMDMDDYTEVLEELYEKYKDKGGKLPPEVRLMFMIIMSGVTFHLSQTLFSSGGINDMVKNNPNPNVLNNLMKKLSGDNKPDLQSNNGDMLNQLKNLNKGKTEETPPVVVNNNDARRLLELERERDALREKTNNYEMQLRIQDEKFRAQMDQEKRKSSIPQQNNKKQQYEKKPIMQPVNQPFVPVNRVLSGGTNIHHSDELNDLFSLDNTSSVNVSDIKPSTVNRPKNKILSDNLSTTSRGKRNFINL